MKGQKTVGWIVTFFLLILVVDVALTSVGGYGWTITAFVREKMPPAFAMAYLAIFFWLLWWPPEPIKQAWKYHPKFRDVVAALIMFLGGHLFFP